MISEQNFQMSQNLLLNSQPNVTDCLLSRIAFPYLQYGLLNGLIINRKQQNLEDCYDGSIVLLL